MKKIMVLASAALLSACASSHRDNCILEHEMNAVAIPCGTFAPCPYYQTNTTATISAAPCPSSQTMTSACRCAYQPNPNREILRPRVTPVAVPQKPRRNCPVDNQTVNCGCGDCPTFQQQAVSRQVDNVYTQPAVAVNPQKAAPKIIMPEAYILAANRTANRFLRDTASIYSQSPDVKLFIKNAVAKSHDLPEGLNEGIAKFRQQLSGSYTFVLTNTSANADYFVETSADWLDTPSKTIPAILYKTTLYDKNGNKINEWIEVVKKAGNTQNWL